MHISSLQNKQIQHLVKLRKKNNRIKFKEILIDDLKAIECALKNRVEITLIYYAKASEQTDEEIQMLNLLCLNNITIIEVDRKVFNKISYGEKHSGFVALANYPNSLFIKDLKFLDSPLIVVIDNIEKPGNIGAILRTADSIGVTAVFVCDQKTDLYNPNIIRASKGVCFSLPYFNLSFEEIKDIFIKHNIKSFALTPSGTDHYLTVDLKFSSAVIVGNEHHGISENWQNFAKPLYIPMQGVADSLNVSVALTILVYEAARQRSGF